MPLITVITNVKNLAPRAMQLHASIGTAVGAIVGKPKERVTLNLEDGKTLVFGGTQDPAALVNADSIGDLEGHQAEFVKAVSKVLQDEIGVDPARCFVKFVNYEGKNCGRDMKVLG